MINCNNVQQQQLNFCCLGNVLCFLLRGLRFLFVCLFVCLLFFFFFLFVCLFVYMVARSIGRRFDFRRSAVRMSLESFWIGRGVEPQSSPAWVSEGAPAPRLRGCVQGQISTHCKQHRSCWFFPTVRLFCLFVLFLLFLIFVFVFLFNAFFFFCSFVRLFVFCCLRVCVCVVFQRFILF